jgi:hypothetical protein
MTKANIIYSANTPEYSHRINYLTLEKMTANAKADKKTVVSMFYKYSPTDIVLVDVTKKGKSMRVIVPSAGKVPGQTASTTLDIALQAQIKKDGLYVYDAEKKLIIHTFYPESDPVWNLWTGIPPNNGGEGVLGFDYRSHGELLFRIPEGGHLPEVAYIHSRIQRRISPGSKDTTQLGVFCLGNLMLSSVGLPPLSFRAFALYREILTPPKNKSRLDEKYLMSLLHVFTLDPPKKKPNSERIKEFLVDSEEADEVPLSEVVSEGLFPAEIGTKFRAGIDLPLSTSIIDIIVDGENLMVYTIDEALTEEEVRKSISLEDGVGDVFIVYQEIR